MKVVSWNVAGINACVKKGLIDFIRKENAEIYCFQEVKAHLAKMPKELYNLKDYFIFNSIANKKGYSGVSVLSKIKPIKTIDTFKESPLNGEGRILVLEFERFFLINAYFPHANRELKRLNFKLKFNEAFFRLCKNLEKIKPLIVAGDFNVAHEEIDLKNPKQNVKNAGFTKEERDWFDILVNKKYIDTFRHFIKEGNHYTWWPYRNNCRKRNIGWRIDYLLISKDLKDKLKESKILRQIYGSDHCPILIDIEN